MRPTLKIATFLISAAALSVTACVGVAAAEYYIPPDNSAVNQYTESFPGAGGESGGRNKKATPNQTLGSGNAERLEEKGTTGAAAAEVAAETAPPQSLYASEESDSGGGKAGKAGNAGGRDSSGGESSAKGEAAGGTRVDQPAGASALGSILGQATGVSDDGGVGLWLPLAIIATIIGSIVYRARGRPGQTA